MVEEKNRENENRKYTKEEPQTVPTKYVASAPDEGLRAYLDDVKRSFKKVKFD